MKLILAVVQADDANRVVQALNSAGFRVTRIATQGALIWMTGFSVILVVFAQQIIRMFTGDAGVIDAGAAALRVMAFSMPPLAILFVYAGGLRGVGNTRAPLIIFGGGLWAIVLITALMVNIINGGLVVVWAVFVVLTPVMAWLMWRQFRDVVRDFQYRGL